MNEVITDLMIKYEDSFLVFLINDFKISELVNIVILFLVIYFGIYVLNYLINLTIVISKLFTMKYKLYEKIGLERMYWNNFIVKRKNNKCN